nr:hypothetical protein [Algoriphagus sp.]
MDLNGIYGTPPKIIYLNTGNLITKNICNLLTKNSLRISHDLESDSDEILELIQARYNKNQFLESNQLNSLSPPAPNPVQIPAASGSR